MSDTFPQPEPRVSPEQLELLLDGQLSGQAARDVESALRQDAAAQQVVTAQNQIDQALKSRFDPPPTDRSVWLALAEQAASEPVNEPATPRVEPTPPQSVARQRRTALFALAASIACIALWGSQWEQIISFWQSPDKGYGRMTVAQFYRGAVDAGFEPDWFCEDEQRFAQTFDERQGRGLLLKPLPTGVRMAGLAYFRGFTPNATCMLAYVDDQPVLVVVERTDLVEESQLLAADGVAIFTRELNGLTLIEVQPTDLTPHDQPRLLPHFFAADPPQEPTGRVPGGR